jgi:hypothetical protein
MANLYNVPTQNSIQRVLANTLSNSETSTITFSVSVSGILQASSDIPGILVVDRIDSNGNLTPNNVEYISFTGVSGSTVTGLTRGLAGTTAKGHAIGAVVEFVPDVVWADALNDVITTQHNSDGTHKTLSAISLVSVTINNSTGNFSNVSITGGVITNVSLVSSSLINRTYIPVEQKFISSVATTTLDFSYSNIHSLTLSSATTTLSFSNPVAGQSLIIRLGQDGTGGRIVVFPSTIYWAGGTAPTLTSTASKTDCFGFLCTASGYYDGYFVGYNL